MIVEPCSTKPAGKDMSTISDVEGPVQVTPSALSQLRKPPHSTPHASPSARRPLLTVPTTLTVDALNGAVAAAPQVDPSAEVKAPPKWLPPSSGAFPTAAKPPP